MEKLILIVEQLEECKRLIQNGAIPQLRMAILLTDNAAEVLMHRAIESQFDSSRMYENLPQNVLQYPQDPKKDEFVTEFQRHIVPDSRKKKIRKFFDEKVVFLSEDRVLLEPSLAKVLSVVHRYRNEAYHQDKLRKATIRPVALLSFEAVCDLLTRLDSKGCAYEGGVDYSWFESRYGLERFQDSGESDSQRIAECLRQGIPLSLQDLREDLFEHLQQRLEDLYSSLDFLSEHSRDPKGKVRDAALKRAQFFASEEYRGKWHISGEYDRFSPRFTLKMLEKWQEETHGIKQLTEKMVVFGEFARLEEFLEPVESIVYEAAASLDHAIQMEIDRKRWRFQ